MFSLDDRQELSHKRSVPNGKLRRKLPPAMTESLEFLASYSHSLRAKSTHALGLTLTAAVPEATAEEETPSTPTELYGAHTAPMPPLSSASDSDHESFRSYSLRTPETTQESLPHSPSNRSSFSAEEIETRPAPRQANRPAYLFKHQVFSVNRHPTDRALYEASLMNVYDQNGAKVVFGDLVRSRRTIVVFVQNWRSPHCVQYLQSVAAEISTAVLGRAHADLIVIGNGSPKMIERYKRASNCLFPVYTDPSRELYKALGMTKLSTDAETSSRFTLALQALKRALRLPFGEPGHAGQLGGEFVFDSTLRLSYAHRMTTSQDHEAIREVCENAGISLVVKATLPLSPSKVHLERKSWEVQRDEQKERLEKLRAARRESMILRGLEPSPEL